MHRSAAAALAALLAQPGAGHAQASHVTWVAGGPRPESRPPAGTVNLALVLGSGPRALRQSDVGGAPHAGPGRTRDVALAEMEGLTAQQLAAPQAEVRFRLHRDAGTFDCRGALHGGRGNGTCDFAADEAFAAELARRGVGRPTAAQQLVLGVHEARLSLLDALAASHVATPTVAELVRAAEAGVDATYVRGIIAAGHHARSLGEVVDLHDRGVQPHP
ncbi:MAG: hypothetical protein JO306_06375 [Gemmatimonadetes bacterium]|nr:hypothetical protein [Gemmatimonadota bacterium]